MGGFMKSYDGIAWASTDYYHGSYMSIYVFID
jgi:hypothetical protein